MCLTEWFISVGKKLISNLNPIFDKCIEIVTTVSSGFDTLEQYLLTLENDPRLSRLE